ncbi:restriction endonuclease subunit R [Longimonas halophila]|uniref:Type I restriction enzyme endonuclease subunit n=1 Tax=Longimonas halophila TaxID=1469170 RepID=A0A2H3NQQ9_9BACT|nr:type I restriction endonuclease subunit R [Longimonas halophila]PEN09583.1 restriction endonuclease subunit R [Longimonas halophila]
MSPVGQIERSTQDRIVTLFRDTLGYRYLGDWGDRADNRNVEEGLLTRWLDQQGYDAPIVSRAVRKLKQAAALGGSTTLYEANRDVYELLRYGVKVKPGAGEHAVTVHLIDWDTPEANDFAVAEEVTVTGENTKRPDLVLYVNGIALGVLELKRSKVSVEEGIRQNLDNQKKAFIEPFFTTMQLVLAGNDTQGLRYGTIQTPEKYYLSWNDDNEVAPDPASDAVTAYDIDRDLIRMCSKDRLLGIVHDFVVFDAGTKKICRPNQYFGVRAAQENVRNRQGGIIWHTQGSGKSLTMVWLAKWIRENVTDARVLIVTDRVELDDQIESVFQGVNEDIHRTESGSDLVTVLNETTPWLLCSLVHKFGRGESEKMDAYIGDVNESLPPDFAPKGELFVFVDEAHRTQSGKLHEAMKAVLPDATFIGFTGTPLLKNDKRRTIEVFGPYIHTYKFDEAVDDGVVLDLRYEARDIDQELTSPEKVDQWFEAKTNGLTDVAKRRLKEKWGTMREVHSSKQRLDKIAQDIQFDMSIRPRLMSGHGNAMLVCGSIYEACRFYEAFDQTDLHGKCAIITSYRPAPSDIKGEESGEGLTEKLRQYKIYRKMLADYFNQSEDEAMGRAEEFEQKVKNTFVNDPGQMKLLIVVDKLLTGFDAPPATYLYIDKTMRDHGLFQAICRVNRLHTEDKSYGYIIDYKDLFKSLEGAINDYTGGALDGYDEEDVRGLLKDRIEQARADLDQALEKVRALCEPVDPPKNTPQYIHYFCAEDTSDRDALSENASKRAALYKHVGTLSRTYAELANEMTDAGYTTEEAQSIQQEVAHYEDVREEVKLASGDSPDMKAYEPAMRHLLDSYIRAEESRVVSTFADLPLIEAIVQRGITEATENLPDGVKSHKDAMAETIENNVRSTIVDRQDANPKYYEKMSRLLDTLIQQRRAETISYENYLKRIEELSRQVVQPEKGSSYPDKIDTSAKQALYDNLGEDADLAEDIDETLRQVKKDGWHGNHFKEREVKRAIYEKLVNYGAEDRTEEIFDLVKNQSDY